MQVSSPLRVPVPLEPGGCVGHRHVDISLVSQPDTLARLLADICEFCLGIFDAPSSLKCKLTPPEVGPAAIGTGTILALRRTSEGFFVAGPVPFLVGLVPPLTGEFERLCLHGLGWC